MAAFYSYGDPGTWRPRPLSPDSDPDADLALILAAFDRTRRHHLKEAAGFTAAAIVVFGVGVLGGSWWLTVV